MKIMITIIVMILWYFNIQCDSLIECRKPDIAVVLKKEKECKVVDIAVLGDSRIGKKELEKMEKYDDLKREIKRMWTMRKIEIIPIVIGALGAISRKLDKWIEKLDVQIRIELLQKTALLGTARILRRSLEGWKTRNLRLLVVASFQGIIKYYRHKLWKIIVMII